ncbi:hypothetical protein EJB05_56074, partial [Eragrostis curvula]
MSEVVKVLEGNMNAESNIDHNFVATSAAKFSIAENTSSSDPPVASDISGPRRRWSRWKCGMPSRLSSGQSGDDERTAEQTGCSTGQCGMESSRGALRLDPCRGRALRRDLPDRSSPRRQSLPSDPSTRADEVATGHTA